MVKAAVILAVGYVLGAKAGRERYLQIKDFAQQVAARVEEAVPSQPSAEPSRH
jgi:hypothetical protein